jgi:hypothetical protein
MSGGVITLSGYHNRKSIRLQGYDYSTPGFYFITICLYDHRQRLFGDVLQGRMVLNDYGMIVRDEWLKTPQIRPNVLIDEYIILLRYDKN